LILYLGDRSAVQDGGFMRYRAALGLSPNSDTRLIHHVRLHADASPVWLSGLQGLPPQVVVSPTAEAALWARKQWPQSQLVFASYADPIQLGLVRSQRAPGTMATGIWIRDDLDAKRLEIIAQSMRKPGRVAILSDDDWATLGGGAARVWQACERLRLTCHLHSAANAAAVQALLDSPGSARYDAWYIPPTTIAYQAMRTLIDGLRGTGHYTMWSSRQEVEQGGQMALEYDTAFAYSTMAELTRRLLAGERAGDIPVERPFRYALIVHDGGPYPVLPAEIMRRADVVISD